MKYNNKWNAIIFSVVITTIMAWLIWSTALYAYSIYFRIIDLKSQIYLSLNAESIKNKQFIDYLTDPINFKNNYDTNSTFNLKKFTRYEKTITDKTIPWELSYFFMTDLDLESSKALNKIKKISLFYNKKTESYSWSELNLNFIRYDKNYNQNFIWWKITLKVDNNCSNYNTSWYIDSNYYCKYDLSDFSSEFKNNIYNYLFFFSSNEWLSYSIQWYDSNWNIVELPSRRLDQEFELSSDYWSVKKEVSSKIDLYDKFNININKWLYNIN